jgi:hypothetical protein
LAKLQKSKNKESINPNKISFFQWKNKGISKQKNLEEQMKNKLSLKN